MPGGARFGDRRRDHLDLLAAEMAGLAAVRIEAGDQDARLRDAEALLQVGVEDAQRLAPDRRA